MAMVTVAGSGCGGDDPAVAEKSTFDVRADTTMTVATGLAKANVIAHMDEACRRAWPKIRQNYVANAEIQAPGLSDRERTADLIRHSLMADIDFHIFDELHFLGAPAGEKVRIERMIGAMQEAVERGQRLGSLYSVPEVVALFGGFNKRASRYGLDACLVDKSHLKISIPRPEPPA